MPGCFPLFHIIPNTEYPLNFVLLDELEKNTCSRFFVTCLIGDVELVALIHRKTLTLPITHGGGACGPLLSIL